MLIIIDV